MACPMRFVLVAISLFIAWFAWWRCQEQEAAEEEDQQQRGSGDCPQQQSGKQRQWAVERLWSLSAMLLDMFSGKYLYRAVVHGIDRPAGHIKAH